MRGAKVRPAGFVAARVRKGETMKLLHCAAAAAFALTACGSSTSNNSQPGQRAETGVYSGTGTIQAISGSQVTIAHGPIAGIGWPAMSMTFEADGSIASGFKAGDKVAFSFRKAGQAYPLTALSHTG
jgi:Cu/Ag efflux protein CusF